MEPCREEPEGPCSEAPLAAGSSAAAPSSAPPAREEGSEELPPPAREEGSEEPSAESSEGEEEAEEVLDGEGVLEGEHDYSVQAPQAGAQVFSGEWDEEGVYFYQAYKDDIADWATEHQRFGGPSFNPRRMTWIKPSFAWVLYRSGYGHKHNQNRILKVKIPHRALAELLVKCKCKEGGGGSKGRVQWDPARDLMAGEGRAPRKQLRGRAIQIGLKGSLSELYVASALSIQDVTALAHRVGLAHASKSRAAMEALLPELPRERPYMPCCTEPVLTRLHLLPPEAPLSGRGGRGGRRPKR